MIILHLEVDHIRRYTQQDSQTMNLKLEWKFFPNSERGTASSQIEKKLIYDNLLL